MVMMTVERETGEKGAKPVDGDGRASSRQTERHSSIANHHFFLPFLCLPMSDPMEIDPFATGSAPDSPRAASPFQPAHDEHPSSDGDDDPSASTSTAGPGPNAEQQQQKQEKPLHQQQPSHRRPPPPSQLPTSRRAYNERAAGEPLSGVARHLAQDGWTIEVRSISSYWLLRCPVLSSSSISLEGEQNRGRSALPRLDLPHAPAV